MQQSSIGPDSGTNLPMGIVGSLVGGIIGTIAWAALIHFTGYEIGVAAWGVGIITGFGSHLLSGGGSAAKGVIAAVFAVLAILGGQYFAMKQQLDGYVTQFGEEIYDYEMELARRVGGAATEDELRQLVAFDHSEEGQELSASDVTDTMMREFREERIPHLAALLDGSLSRYDYLERVKTSIRENVSMVDILKDSFSLFTLLWIALGVGSAFKLASRGD